MKLFKYFTYLILVILLIFIEVANPVINTVQAKAKTLRTMKAELAELEKELAQNKQQQQSAQSGINSSKQRMTQISQEKVDIVNEVEDLSEEIVKLNNEIVEMNEEVKELLAYYQVSKQSDSTALEYVFGAEDYTDFIYRMAIAEQLTEYEEETIESYNKKISENENKKVELANKQSSLVKKEDELEKYIKEQKSKLSEALDGAIGIEDEIAALKKNIYLYEVTYKCKLDQTIDQCLAGKLPAGSKLYRPIVTGRISSNYGRRSYKLNGRWTSDFHYGLDFAGTHGIAVYSAGNGKVAAIFPRKSCGGNMVYINHIINGKKYTTAYYHLGSVKVKVGQTVTYETQIGTQGGSPGIETWDHCSTGSHTHFSVSTGNWGNDYNSYSGFIARNINPRNVVNAPALGKSFSGRSTKY